MPNVTNVGVLSQIAFEGITENGFEGDIAIDDVSVTDGNCAVDDRVQTVVVDIDTSSIVPDIDDQLPDLEINQGRRRPDLNQRRRRPDSVDRRRRPDLEDRRRRLQLARIGRRRNWAERTVHSVPIRRSDSH